EAASCERRGRSDLAAIEVQLRQEEMSLRELRVARDRRFVRAPLPVRVAELFVHLPEVELRHVAVRMPIDLQLVLGGRAPQIAALLGREREVEVRVPQVPALGERRADLALAVVEAA